LLLAALDGQKDVAQLLVDRGADFKATDATGVSWLVRALSSGVPAHRQRTKQSMRELSAHLGAFAEGAASPSEAARWRAMKARVEVSVDMFE